MRHYAAGLRFTIECDSPLLFVVAYATRQQFLAENQNLDYSVGHCLLSPAAPFSARERREAAEYFLALSGDNPLKTLDSKEQKKGKEDQKKGKESKIALSRTFHSLRERICNVAVPRPAD